MVRVLSKVKATGPYVLELISVSVLEAARSVYTLLGQGC